MNNDLAIFSLPVTATALVMLVVSFVAAINFFLAYKVQTRENPFSQLIVWVSVYIFCHATFIFIAETWQQETYWKDRVAPFSLMYGPFLYFGTIAVKKTRLSLQLILLHSALFIGYFLYFILFISGIIKITPANEHLLRDHIVVLNPISFILYTILGFYEGRSILFGRFKGKVLLFIFSRAILVFATMLSLAIAFSDRVDGSNQAAELIRMTMYICILLCTLAILNYTVNKLVARRRADQVLAEHEPDVQQPKYERSALSAAQMQEYRTRLDHALKSEMLFLNKDLSLSQLADHLQMPNHHLTQVFSMEVNQTFYQYINHLRIQHACLLLRKYPSGIRMERLAEDSGFNSKVSFNRHFKEQMGCTPSAWVKVQG